MAYNAVGWFEIPVTDIGRAQKFYEELLGVKLETHDEGGYEMRWFSYDPNGMGASGALVKGMGFEPSKNGTVVYFSGPDLDGRIDRANKLGAKILLPKKDIGEYGHIVWLEDSEGNKIALHEGK